MKARKYTNRIEIWKRPETDDSFGGSVYDTPSEKLGESWCNIKTLSQQRIIDLGLLDFKHSIQINLRKRNDLDYTQNDIYFVYKGKEYIKQSLIEVNLDGYEIQITASLL